MVTEERKEVWKKDDSGHTGLWNGMITYTHIHKLRIIHPPHVQEKKNMVMMLMVEVLVSWIFPTKDKLHVNTT